jgi:hypothetical protein
MLEPIQQSFWCVSRGVKIPAPTEVVWEAIAAPGNLEACHPFVSENPVEKWPGAGAKDMVRYYSGLTYYREFCAWEGGQGYDLLIGKKRKLNSKVFWRVESCGEKESTLSITVRFLEKPGLKVLYYWFPILVYLRPLMKKYLDSVVGGYKYFITTGEPVPRNHFGALMPFSPSGAG